ncbi:MAG TPA: hypothetical protein VHG27_09500 [Xanthobacteraceae bacterium]|nr:hypothetical protein [Xanthobacteraceae bacterium]
MDDTKARRRSVRQERLEAALRENLRRRKAQARSRAAQEQKDSDTQSSENAPASGYRKERG